MQDRFQITPPWEGINLKMLEIGGGDTPLYRPNMDMRRLPTVDIVTDLEGDWPVESETFDGVFGKYVIEHMSWRKIPHFAAEIFRVLKPGGSAMMIGPNTLNQCREIARRNRITIDESAMLFGGQEERGWNEHKAAFSPEYIKEIFAKAGFDRIEVEDWPQTPTDMILKVWKSKKKTEVKMTKLNIGSFTVMAKGWTNCDILDLSAYAAQNGYDFKRFDAAKEIPYPDGSVHLIIASHFLEHLTRIEGDNFLKEALRVLEPNGVIRITVPDLETITRAYFESRHGLVDQPFRNWFKDNEGVKNATDDAEAFWNFLTSGHKTAYDRESLVSKMKAVGFLEVKDMHANESRSSEIQSETKDMYPDHSIYIEAVKTAIVQPIAPATFQSPETDTKFKIGLISTQFFGLPPKGYSGLEMVVWDLAAGLSELGHSVTLFAPEGSKPPQNGKVVFTGPPLSSVNTNWSQSEANVWNIVIGNCSDLDLLHGHNWFGFEYMAKEVPSNKICHTHHGHLNTDWWCRAKPPYKLNFIAISQFMKKEYESLGIPSEYVYNGIDLNRYPYQEKKGDRLLFVGRLDSFKRPHIAIEIAKKMGMGLDIVGGSFVSDVPYMDSIKAACDGTQIKLHLDASHEEKVYLYQNARTTIFPSLMKEPFGLIVPETGSCGTPVVGSRDGAIPETIEEGVTGFVCDTVDQMIEAVKKADTISPQACRKRAEEKFSRRIMAENYAKLYQRMLKGDEW
jgi:glycosyltransferase involved in cell wall biosynthesis/predicted SAM-dependent methyltransferase